MQLMFLSNNILPGYKSIGEFYQDTIQGVCFYGCDLVSSMN
jgi:hypothetical protein